MRSYWSAIRFFLCRDLPRLSCFVERDEGELAFRDDGFRVSVPGPRDRFCLEPQRRAALLQQVDENAELVADRHRTGEFVWTRRDEDRLPRRPARGEGAAGEAHLAHQPAAEHAAIRVGVGGHRGHADDRLTAQASIPSGFSTSRLNACISFAPSAPSIARWSKLPVALITVAICSDSLMT